MNKKTISFIFSAILLMNIAYAETPPEFTGTTFINEGVLGIDPNTGKKVSNVDGLKKDRVWGDDTLPKTEVDTGKRINRKLGERNSTTVIDKSGNTAVLKKGSTTLDASNAADYKTDEERAKSQEIEDKWREGFENYLNSTGTDDHEKNEVANKRKAQEENKRQGFSIRSVLDQTINSRDITSGAQTVKQMFENMDDDITDEELRKDHQDAVEIYKESGFEPKKADTGVILQKNVGAIKKAYKNLPELQKQLTEKLKQPIIQCQISRNLIPTYYCPIKGRDGFRFPGNIPDTVKKEAAKTELITDSSGRTIETLVNPDAASIVEAAPSLRRVNLTAAKNTCNQYCKSGVGDFKCVKNKKLKKAEIDVTQKELELFPTYDETEAVMEITAQNIIPVKDISFKVNVLRTKEDENISEEEWQQFLKTADIKFKYSITELPESKDLAPFTIVDRAYLRANKETAVFTIPINRILTKLQFKLWKPYITENPFRTHEYDNVFDEFKEKFGGKITITEIKANYTSDSFYYCPIRQLVAAPKECGGLESVEINYGEGKDQNRMYLCKGAKYKIGPESETGAFFDEDSCNQNCFITEQCLTTYDQYQGNYGNDATIYKAEIDCVDDDSNRQCTKEQCIEYFKNVDLRPVNEAVVQNDNTLVYTVRNKALTDVLRPKIDIERELNANLNDREELEKMINAEQKDAAYLYMTKNLTMNMIKYPIGTPSPHKMSYSVRRGSTAFDGWEYSVDLKPNSFDFNKDLYMYMVVRVDQLFPAKYGSYYVRKEGSRRTTVQTKQDEPLMFKDYTYLIKKPDNSWEVFRKEEFAEFFLTKVVTTINEQGEVDKKLVKEWIIQPDDGLIPAYFGKYDAASNTFRTFDKSERAISFKKEHYDLADNVYKYIVTKDHISDFYDTPGSLIHSQSPKDNESNLLKEYQGGIDSYFSGKMQDFSIYLLYSEEPLTYDALMKKIEGENYAINTQKTPPSKNEWAAFNYLGNITFNSGGVDHDGQLHSNIKPFILGKPNNSAVITEWEPSLSENGKKVFKFLFLYDESVVNPFHRDDNKPDKYVEKLESK